MSDKRTRRSPSRWRWSDAGPTAEEATDGLRSSTVEAAWTGAEARGDVEATNADRQRKAR
jgi:predicted nucleotidyltransferase